MTVTTMTMTEQEKIAIAHAKIVFVVAVSGCGKSFTSDYLHFMHGYTHVDGDGPIKKRHIPRNKELVVDFITCMIQHIQKGEDGPEELWQPYYSEIVNNTIEAAKHSDKVVLSQASYQQSHHEFTVEKLVEGGATRGNITLLELMVNPDVKLKGLYYRTKEQMENGGMSIGDKMRTDGWEGVGDATCAEYIEFQTKEHPEYTGNCAYVEMPIGYGDVSGRDMTHLDGVDEALGLVRNRHNQTLTFGEIRDKVKTFEQQRDEEFASTGAQEIMYKIIKQVSGESVDDEDKGDNVIVASDVEEQEKITKRRSTLISVEYLEREYKKIMKARCKSLFQIGKK